MSGHDQKFLDLAALYAVGVLDSTDRDEFEAHLKADCAICKAEIVRIEKAAALLPAVLPPGRLNPELKERILFAARLASVAKKDIEERTSQPEENEIPFRRVAVQEKTRRPWLAVGIAFAAVVMAVGFAAYIATMFEKLDGQYQHIVNQRDTISSQQARIAELKTALDKKDAMLKVLESRRIEIVTMNGMPADSMGYGKVIWDPATRTAILHAVNLPMPPPDRDYQLWVMKGQVTVSAGVISVREPKETLHMVQPMVGVEAQDIAAFAVTLEPKGGMAQPTGEMYLMGKVDAR